MAIDRGASGPDPGPPDPLLESWALVEPHADRFTALFYEHLFVIEPRAREMFSAVDMNAQRGKLFDMLNALIDLRPHEERFVHESAALARRHVGYRVRAEDYKAVGEALIWALQDVLGDAFTPEQRRAWTETYATLAGVMLRAAGRGEANSELRTEN